MTMWLKQSTAQTIVLGPFVDDTDFKTEETGLTISQADIRLSKNGGAFAQSNNAAGATHMENGYYSVPLDTTDTNTLGRLDVNVDEAGALKVWQSFMVAPANVWDSMFGADNLQVDVTQFGGTAGTFASGIPDVNAAKWSGGTIVAPAVTGVPKVDVTHFGGTGITSSGGIPSVNMAQISLDSVAADNLESFMDGTGYAGTNNVIPSVTTVTGNVNGSVGSVTGAVGSVTGAVGSVSAGGITASSIAADAIGASELAADAVTEIVTGVLTTTMTEAYAADGAAPTLAQALFLIQQALTEFAIAGTTITVKKLDGSTTAATFTLDSSTTPTSRTRAT